MTDSIDITSAWPALHLTQDTFIVQNGFRCALDVMDTAEDTGQEPRIVLTSDVRIETCGFRATVLAPLSGDAFATNVVAGDRTWDVFLRDGDGERKVGPIAVSSEDMAWAGAHRWYGDTVTRVVRRKR